MFRIALCTRDTWDMATGCLRTGVIWNQAPHWAGPVAEIRNLRSQGHTLRGIAATLNKRVHRTRRGYRRAAGIGSQGDKLR